MEEIWSLIQTSFINGIRIDKIYIKIVYKIKFIYLFIFNLIVNQPISGKRIMYRINYGIYLMMVLLILSAFSGCILSTTINTHYAVIDSIEDFKTNDLKPLIHLNDGIMSLIWVNILSSSL